VFIFVECDRAGTRREFLYMAEASRRPSGARVSWFSGRRPVCAIFQHATLPELEAEIQTPLAL